jgi:hypothetical protein
MGTCFSLPGNLAWSLQVNEQERYKYEGGRLIAGRHGWIAENGG